MYTDSTPPGAAPPAEDAVFVLPASAAQARMWFMDQLSGGGAAYNMPVAVRLAGRLDRGALTEALAGVLRRHEALRTTFSAIGGEPVQVVHPAGTAAWPLVDLSGLDAGTRAAEAERILTAEARRPFDLGRGPLLRTVLLRLGPEEHVALCGMHHIVSDGWSLRVLLREITAGYAAALDGGSPPPEPPLQYADFAAWQNRWLQGEGAARQLAYWQGKLAGAPRLELPTDRPRAARPGDRGGRVPFHLSAALLGRLRALGPAQGATVMMTLLAAFKVLLARYAGQADVVVGVPVAGRGRPELEGLIGLFANTLALRTDLGGDPAFGEALARVRDTVVWAQMNQDLPFDRVADALRDGAPGRGPVFDVLLNHARAEPDAARLPGLALSGARAETGATRFDLELHLVEDDGGVEGRFVYRAELYAPGTVERMAGHLARLLEAAADAPGTPVSRLPLLTAAEHARIVEEWNRPGHAHPAECIHHRFQARAARTPDAVAVVHGDASLTYGALNARANRLAHRLARLGVGPEVRVGICLERGVELVAGILAVLKAGGAYVPLDPCHPPARLAFTLADAGAPVLLTEKALLDALTVPPGVRVVTTDGSGDEIDAESAENPERGGDPASLAYVIYTSGSTGAPKGVLVEHRAVARLFRATDAWFRFGPDDVWTLFHSAAFDFSVWEMWGALLHGGRLVVVPFDASRDPGALHALLRREGVTVLNQTPSAFRQLMLEDGERGGELALRTVISLAGAQVAFHQRRRNSLRIGDVVEAVADGVGRQELIDVDVDRERVLHRARILGAVQALRRTPAGIRIKCGPRDRLSFQRRGQPGHTSRRRTTRARRRHRAGAACGSFGKLGVLEHVGGVERLQRHGAGLGAIVVASDAVLLEQRVLLGRQHRGRCRRV